MDRYSHHCTAKTARSISGERMPRKECATAYPPTSVSRTPSASASMPANCSPGDAVASERDLAKIHQVSLMTARHALASLEREGIVERRRGIGTFVAAPKIHFNKLMSYTEQMSSRSLTAGSKVLFAKVHRQRK